MNRQESVVNDMRLPIPSNSIGHKHPWLINMAHPSKAIVAGVGL